LFQFFDKDGNGVLDNEEMGQLNAALFNMFPRFGYKGLEPPG
jgi:Ca2+-binding EF-hand superfamily protein